MAIYFESANPAALLAAFKNAAADLVAKRYLLPDDSALLVKRAESEGIRSGP